MIVDTIANVYQFRDAFAQANRKTQFSYEGLEVLFDYLEELSDSIGENIELDVIGLCCDYAEDTPEAIAQNYGVAIHANPEELEDTFSIPSNLELVVDYLEKEGVYIGETPSGTIVYQQF